MVFRQIQTEDGQWCAAPFLFSRDLANSYGEPGRALAYLNREARLYKGAREVSLSQSTTPRSTGNISVREEKSATATHVK